MRKIHVLIFVLFALFTSGAHAQTLQSFNFKVNSHTTLRVGLMNPVGATIGDVIYLHGFSDRLDNHDPLFRELASRGMRVVSFDYPSHGKTQASSLGWYSFEKLAALVASVEAKTLQDQHRPLAIVGWSTGGLLAARMAQTGYFKHFSRFPSALVLYAPGVAVYPLPGKWGFVTEDTLTSNKNAPHHFGSPRPRSPFSKPIFGFRLLANSVFSRLAQMPVGLPVLTFVGGDAADVYANSAKVKRWVLSQRKINSQMPGIQCSQGKHELDNEFEPLGETVRKTTAEFIESINFNRPTRFDLPAASSCSAF